MKTCLVGSRFLTSMVFGGNANTFASYVLPLIRSSSRIMSNLDQGWLVMVHCWGISHVYIAQGLFFDSQVISRNSRGRHAVAGPDFPDPYPFAHSVSYCIYHSPIWVVHEISISTILQTLALSHYTSSSILVWVAIIPHLRYIFIRWVSLSTTTRTKQPPSLTAILSHCWLLFTFLLAILRANRGFLFTHQYSIHRSEISRHVDVGICRLYTP